jgi:hypothetical protein
MPVEGDVFIRRDSWGSRFDKVWWLGGTLFYGSPCVALLIAGAVQRHPVTAMIAGLSLVGLGIFNWRIRSSRRGRLLAEVSADGIRVRENGPMLPWSDVDRVGFARVGGGGTVASSEAVVMHLVGGGRLLHVFSGHRIEGIHDDVCAAIRHFAPQIPISDDDEPLPS